MAKLGSITLVVLAIFALTLDTVVTINHGAANDPLWAAYKRDFGKDYSSPDSPTTEAVAYYYYNYNKRVIDNHNAYYRRGLRTFGLRVNQFSDMRVQSFNLLFPVATQPATSTDTATPLPPVAEQAPDSFNPLTDVGLDITSADQGTKCNSGWAYATANAIAILQAYQTGQNQAKNLSAQNLIDCAGQSRGCTNQVPQAAFDFLMLGEELHEESAYPNQPLQAEQGMCRTVQNPATTTATLKSYSRLNNDQELKRYVSTYPVIVEFNPTSFEFMHYAEGVFQQPRTYRGSHFMTVIGYGRNETSSLDYFTLQNSFGPKWGINGAIQIAYSARAPLTKNAILPTLV